VELYHFWPALQMNFSEHGVSRLQAQRNDAKCAGGFLKEEEDSCKLQLQTSAHEATCQNPSLTRTSWDHIELSVLKADHA